MTEPDDYVRDYDVDFTIDVWETDKEGTRL